MDKAYLAGQISKAKEAHESWKQKLRDGVATGQLPKAARDIACDDQCAFGKWLHGLKADPALSVSLQYRKVVAMHADFHLAAGEIAAMIETGDRAAAQAALDGPDLNNRSRTLSEAMTNWQNSL